LPGLSDYEKERLITIARNQAFLKSLGIEDDKKEIARPKAATTKRKRTKNVATVPTKRYPRRSRGGGDGNHSGGPFLADDESSGIGSEFSESEFVNNEDEKPKKKAKTKKGPRKPAAKKQQGTKARQPAAKSKKPRTKHSNQEAEALLSGERPLLFSGCCLPPPLTRACCFGWLAAALLAPTFDEMAERYRMFMELCPGEHPKPYGNPLGAVTPTCASCVAHFSRVPSQWVHRTRSRQPGKNRAKICPLSFEELATVRKHTHSHNLAPPPSQSCSSAWW